MKSELEAEFEELWESLYPEIDLYAEYKPFGDSKHRLDFACPETKTAIEIQGGNWAGGRHTRPEQLDKEYAKLNKLAFNGWVTFLLSGEMITKENLEMIAHAILSRKTTQAITNE